VAGIVPVETRGLGGNGAEGRLEFLTDYSGQSPSKHVEVYGIIQGLPYHRTVRDPDPETPRTTRGV